MKQKILFSVFAVGIVYVTVLALYTYRAEKAHPLRSRPILEHVSFETDGDGNRIWGTNNFFTTNQTFRDKSRGSGPVVVVTAGSNSIPSNGKITNFYVTAGGSGYVPGVDDWREAAERAHAESMEAHEITRKALAEAEVAQDMAFKYKALYEQCYTNLLKCYQARQREGK